MATGIAGPFDSATRQGGVNRIMHNNDRTLPQVLPSALGSWPYTSAQVWRNDDSSGMHTVVPVIHSQNDALDDTVVVTTVSFYLVRQDNHSVGANHRIARYPLVASESCAVGEVPITVGPGDVLLAVDNSGNGVTCYCNVIRQI